MFADDLKTEVPREVRTSAAEKVGTVWLRAIRSKPEQMAQLPTQAMCKSVSRRDLRRTEWADVNSDVGGVGAPHTDARPM